jgi:hypothetical protein
VEAHKQNATTPAQSAVDLRRHPRFAMETEICIYPRDSTVARGRTVDISESGLSALITSEIPVGEVIRLAFALPLGRLEIFAMVRQRSAFRYGFQFVEESSEREIIIRTCRQLAMDQSLFGPRRE